MSKLYNTNKEIPSEYKSGDGIFFTSDTHFGHDNIIRFCNRPFKDLNEMNYKLIENWNSVVGPDDVVFHLGDFAWGGAPLWRSIRSQLNGHIVLVIGNHDVKNLKQTAANDLFDAVVPQLQLTIEGRSVYLNHYPFLAYGGAYRGDSAVWQLFGHVHTHDGGNGKDDERMKYLFPTQYDVGVDNNNFTPVSWEEIKRIINRQTK